MAKKKTAAKKAKKTPKKKAAATRERGRAPGTAGRPGKKAEAPKPGGASVMARLRARRQAGKK